MKSSTLNDTVTDTVRVTHCVVVTTMGEVICHCATACIHTKTSDSHIHTVPHTVEHNSRALCCSHSAAVTVLWVVCVCDYYFTVCVYTMTHNDTHCAHTASNYLRLRLCVSVTTRHVTVPVPVTVHSQPSREDGGETC